MKNKYFNEVCALLEKIETNQSEALNKAASALAETIAKDGIIYTFGAGHSHSGAVENFHRSGSPACVSAILDPALAFMPSAHAATALERLEGLSPIMLKRHNLTDKDCIIIISNSGRNPAGVDAALYAKEKGLKVIVITAVKAHEKTISRHSSGKMLRDCADILIDNCCSKQETALKLDGKDIAPISTIAVCSIINSIMYEACEILSRQGKPIPLYLSSNDGGDENNTKLAEKYKDRIIHLT